MSTSSLPVRVAIEKSLYKLQSVASTDKDRQNITGVSIEENIAVAIDGHCLVAIPIDKELTTAAKGIYELGAGKSKKTDHSMTTFLTLVGETYISEDGYRAAPIDGQFPDWKLIIPEKIDDTCKVTIDIEILIQIAKALGTTELTLCVKPPPDQTDCTNEPISILPANPVLSINLTAQLVPCI